MVGNASRQYDADLNGRSFGYYQTSMLDADLFLWFVERYLQNV